MTLHITVFSQSHSLSCLFLAFSSCWLPKADSSGVLVNAVTYGSLALFLCHIFNLCEEQKKDDKDMERILSRDWSRGRTLKGDSCNAHFIYFFLFFESEKITMILFSFVRLFSIHWLSWWQVIEGEEEVIFKTDLAGPCDVGHMRNSKFTSYNSIAKNSGRQKEPGKEQSTIPDKRSGLTSRYQMESHKFLNGMWGKKTKAIRITELTLLRIIMLDTF